MLEWPQCTESFSALWVNSALDTRAERKAGTLAETGFRLIHCSIIEDDRHNYALVFYKPKANATVGLG